MINPEDYQGSEEVTRTAASLVNEYIKPIVTLAEETAPSLAYIKEVDEITDQNFENVVTAVKQIYLANKKMERIPNGIVNFRYELIVPLIESSNIPNEIKNQLKGIIERMVNEVKSSLFNNWNDRYFFDSNNFGNDPILTIFEKNWSSELLKSTNYQTVVNKFREELHQAVKEYWERKSSR